MEYNAKSIHRRTNVNVGELHEIIVDLDKGTNATSVTVDSLGYQKASIQVVPEGNAGTGAVTLKESNIKSQFSDFAAGAVSLVSTATTLVANIDISTQWLEVGFAGGGTGKFKIYVALSR